MVFNQYGIGLLLRLPCVRMRSCRAEKYIMQRVVAAMAVYLCQHFMLGGVEKIPRAVWSASLIPKLRAKDLEYHRESKSYNRPGTMLE